MMPGPATPAARLVPQGALVSALTHHSTRPALPLPVRLRKLGETIRWAPAPCFEGTAARRWMFVGYMAVSMLAWTIAGLAVAAALGALVS
jgi:hypothetical protein